MKPSAFMFFLISSAACINLKLISKRNSVDGCIDWSVDLQRYRSLAGEPVRLKCALFYSYIKTNYTMAQNAKLRLIWYKNKGDSEEPIIFSGQRLSKEEDSIWFRSAMMEDNGFYTCVLRNSTYCMKVSMALTVEESDPGLCYSSKIRYHEKAEITKPKTLTCPDIEDYIAPYKQPKITWYKECKRKTWRSSIKVNATSIHFLEVREEDGGNYTCELRYGSRLVRRTAELKVTGVSGWKKCVAERVLMCTDVTLDMDYGQEKIALHKPSVTQVPGWALLTRRPPKVLFPMEKPPSIIEAQLGMPFSLDCRAFFGYSGESRPIIYWMKGEKFVEELEGHIRESDVRVLREYLGEKEVELSLTFDIVEETDMGNYTCYVENHIGRKEGNVILRKRDGLRMELATGLGAALLLLGLLTSIYKCYRVEITLCYRQHFGSDEAEHDNKEYDAYLSYTKVAMESAEQEGNKVEGFVQEVLPDVLENHYGYKLFIPDRDLIPSSIYMEELTRSLEQSRRLIIVLTPSFVAQRGWSVFQLEARLHSMLVTGKIKVIMIECPDLRSVINYQEVEALKHTIKLLSIIKWTGPKSNQPRSRFWKQILYEMPARRKETFPRRQVLDSGEQGFFADLQSISTLAVTTSTPTALAPVRSESPQLSMAEQAHARHFCQSFEYQMPSTPVRIATMGNSHVYCNVPMILLNGQMTQDGSPAKNKPDVPLGSTFIPLSSRELTSDIW